MEAVAEAEAESRRGAQNSHYTAQSNNPNIPLLKLLRDIYTEPPTSASHPGENAPPNRAPACGDAAVRTGPRSYSPDAPPIPPPPGVGEARPRVPAGPSARAQRSPASRSTPRRAPGLHSSRTGSQLSIPPSSHKEVNFPCPAPGNLIG